VITRRGRDTQRRPITSLALICSTVRRWGSLQTLLRTTSLGSQSPDVVILVNQSGESVPTNLHLPGDRLVVISDPERGLCRGRNLGLNHLLKIVPANETSHWLVGFPDDDVWFDGDTLSRATAAANESGASFVAGRLLLPNGEDSRANWPRNVLRLTHANLVGRTVEAATFIRLSVFVRLGVRFNESMGAGSSLGLGSGEGIELLLRITDDSSSYGVYAPQICIYEHAWSCGREKEELYALGEGAALQWGLRSRRLRIWRLYVRPQLRPLRSIMRRQAPDIRIAWHRARLVRAGSRKARRIAAGSSPASS
jgi:hypothetical protein